MELEDLRRFAVVARRGGIAAAAAELGMEASTLSRRIAGLERAAGARLLHRTTRSMSLTAEGARLLEGAEAALDALDAARAEIAGQGRGAGGVAGVVRITASTAFGEWALAPRLGALRARHPGLSVELSLTDAPLDLAAAGMDLALRLGPEPEGPATRLRPVRHLVCAAPAWAAGRAVDGPEALRGVDCLLYAMAGLRDAWSLRRPGEAIRRIPVSGPLALSSAAALRRAAVEGLGPAALADWLVEEDLAAGRLVDLLPGWEAAPSRFGAALWLMRPGTAGARAAAAPPPRRVQAAMDWLVEAFGA
ncbi:LysR substrate-binding domain-containing protein [Rhodovulum sp. DZ06]|uniref:LysR substrate-binding domain-containing protein n=1 Tax=Rhodovulum sp. DZ06 TaxID=3425126 RepID=UPI003D333467